MQPKVQVNQLQRMRRLVCDMSWCLNVFILVANYQTTLLYNQRLCGSRGKAWKTYQIPSLIAPKANPLRWRYRFPYKYIRDGFQAETHFHDKTSDKYRRKQSHRWPQSTCHVQSAVLLLLEYIKSRNVQERFQIRFVIIYHKGFFPLWD